MSIVALALYGSCARQDHGAGSDVDLFGICKEGDYQMVVANNVNLARYPESLAFAKAEMGDLFMLHIVSESKTIYDSIGVMDRLRKSFEFKNSYSKEVKDASDLGWLLVKWGMSSKNKTLVNRRIAWCVRTILIARSAEERTPRFSAESLSQYSGWYGTNELIKIKNSASTKSDIIAMFEEFLGKFGDKEPDSNRTANVTSYAMYMRRHKNAVGAKTAEMMLSEKLSDAYV